MIRIGIGRCLLAACAAGAIVLGPQTSQAQTTYEYAAKFVCNKPSTRSLVEVGFYSVAVNVHNPSAKPTKFKCKAALAGTDKDGKISAFKCAEIGPDAVRVYSCPFFVALLSLTPGTFIDGFFVIQSDTKLDVTAYYTSVGILAIGQPNKVNSPSIAVERIHERVIIAGVPQ